MEVLDHSVVLKGRKDLNRYLFGCSFYKSPPKSVASLDLIEEIALNRLNLLREIDHLTMSKKTDDEFFSLLTSKVSQLEGNGCYSNKIIFDSEISDLKEHENILKQREYDNMSHFLLRLSFCSNEENRRWLINQEAKLFSYRFQQIPYKYLQFFLNYNEIEIDAVSIEEIDSKELVDYYYGHVTPAIFKVDFLEAIDLLKNRQVYLLNGYAYVPLLHLRSLVCHRFKSYLHNELIRTLHSCVIAEEDDRLIPLLNHLRKAQNCKFVQYNNSSQDKIDLSQIDAIADQSFPLCMLNLHQRFRTNHHLKYKSRLQYGLFLKGIGLSMEESLDFWKREFTKKIDDQKFERMYAYNIRYMYGEEGRKKTMYPYGCMPIINSVCDSTDCNGCPFKNFDEKGLRNILEQRGIDEASKIEILSFRSKSYQMACSKYFQSTHKKLLEEVEDIFIEHPNKYFDLSRSMINRIK